MPTITVAICSPIPALRAGLRALLSADPDLIVVAAVPDLAALGGEPSEARVVVATPGGIRLGSPAAGDLSQDDGPPGEFDPAVLFISDDGEEARSLARLELRAWGVISPEAPAEALQAAVRALAEGLVVVSPDLYQRLVDPAQQGPLWIRPEAGEDSDEIPADRLTGREVEVLRCLALGQTNKQAALALKISEHTVKFHVSAIFAKLGVSNRAEAVRAGARKGLVPL